MQAHSQQFRVATMYRMLKIERSGYYRVVSTEVARRHAATCSITSMFSTTGNVVMDIWVALRQ